MIFSLVVSSLVIGDIISIIMTSGVKIAKSVI